MMTTYTANPILGRCPHYGTDLCGTYCYAEKGPHWNEEPFFAAGVLVEIKQLQTSSTRPEFLTYCKQRKVFPQNGSILIGSMFDIWADAIPQEWIDEIYRTAVSVPNRIFFLTKNPDRYLQVEPQTHPHNIFFPAGSLQIEPPMYPQNIWFGAATPDKSRALATSKALSILKSRGAKTYVIAQPLLEPIAEYLDPSSFDGLIIGSLLSDTIRPERKWITDLLSIAEKKPVFLQPNLFTIYPDLPRREDKFFSHGNDKRLLLFNKLPGSEPPAREW
jgi:protein gp37